MGLFSKSKTKYVDPMLLLPGYAQDIAKGQISELEGYKARAQELPEEMKKISAPTRGRLSELLESGQFRSEDEEAALGYARELLGVTPEKFMGGYDPTLAQQAIRAGYEADAPDAIKRLLTSAGLQAPGIHHGRVREEAATAAGGLYDEMLARLAEENRWAAQFGRGAEEAAFRTRGAGAEYLGTAGSLAQELQIQQAIQDYLTQLEILGPEGMRSAQLEPYMAYDPKQWTKIPITKTKQGLVDKVAGVAGAIGSVGSLFTGGPALGGFSSLLGGLGGGDAGASPGYTGTAYSPQTLSYMQMIRGY